MNYSQIEAFVDLVETKSFSQTAQRLSVSQPAISQRIHALEKNLNCLLLERRGEELVITHAGNYLYEQGKKIIALWKTTHTTLEHMQVSLNGSIRIGASTIPSQFFISPMIKAFRNNYPNIQTQVHVAGTETVIQWLVDDKVDVAIIGSYPADHSEFEIFPIAHDQLQMIIPASHPWTNRPSVSIDELQDATLILREKQSGTRKILESEFQKLGIQFKQSNILDEFGSTDAVIAAVENGLGVSFVSKFAAERAIKLQRVCSIPVDGLNIEREFYFAAKKEHQVLSITKFSRFIRNRLQAEQHID